MRGINQILWLNKGVKSRLLGYMGVRLAKNDFGSVLQKTVVFGSVSVLQN